MSQLLVLLISLKKLLSLRKKLFIRRSLPDRFSLMPSFQRCSFLMFEFRCSTTKETTFAVCSTKLSVQILNIYTLKYAINKNYYVVIDIGWCIIIVIRMITVCGDTDLAIFFYLVIYILIFHIVR